MRSRQRRSPNRGISRCIPGKLCVYRTALGFCLACIGLSRSGHATDQFWLAGMFARDEIANGQFDIKSSWIEQYKESDEVFDGSYAGTCFFDFTKKLLRFDQTQAVELTEGEPGKARQQLSAKYVRTPEHSLHWNGVSATISRRPADHKPPAGCNPFDVRAIGLTVPSSYRNRFVSFETIKSVYESNSTTRVESLGDGNALLVSKRLATPVFMLQRVWLTEQSGAVVPTKLEVFFSANDFEPGAELPPSTYQVDAQWEKVADVVVPIAFDTRSTDPESDYRCNFELEWKTVNSGIDESVFSYESFDAKAGTFVNDTTLGDTFLVERIGGAPAFSELPTRPDHPLGQSAPMSSKKFWLLALNGLLLALLSIGYFISKKRSR